MPEIIGQSAPDGTYQLLIATDGLNQTFQQGQEEINVRVDAYPYPPSTHSFIRTPHAILIIARIRADINSIRTQGLGVNHDNTIVIANGNELIGVEISQFTIDPISMVETLREAIRQTGS